ARALGLPVERVHILDAPVTLRVVLERRQFRKPEEMHGQVAPAQNGVSTKLIGPPAERLKAEALIERARFGEIPRREDGNRSEEIHRGLPSRHAGTSRVQLAEISLSLRITPVPVCHQRVVTPSAFFVTRSS